MVGDPRQSSTVLGVLTVLTMMSGFVDAVSFLGLGQVFTANMTGNVVLLGFALVGASGLSVWSHLTSVLCFVAGAAVGGRLASLSGSHRRSLLMAMTVEGLFAGGAAVVAAIGGGKVVSGWEREVVIAILAVAMGMRNATVRRLAVPDIATTVLTTTLTGLAADSWLAGGTDPRAGRRVSAVVAMLTGAVAGAAIVLHQGPAWSLVAVAVIVLAAAAVFARHPASYGLDEPPPEPT